MSSLLSAVPTLTLFFLFPSLPFSLFLFFHWLLLGGADEKVLFFVLALHLPIKDFTALEDFTYSASSHFASQRQVS